MHNFAQSNQSRREITRAKVAELIWAAFGDSPDRTQAAISRSAARLAHKSQRQIINYMQRKSDAPHYVVEILEEYVVEKTNRLARRIEGQ